jgi:CheY-like chemotaxis protein
MDSPIPSTLSAPPGRLPRILLVDSVLPILRAISGMLDPYEVEMATSGAQALVRLATLPAFDVVLCDLYLDDLAGRDLYRQACARSPELRARFIFMTGDPVPPHGLEGEFSAVRVLSRPFEPEQLFAVIHELVNGPPRAEV